HARVRVFAGGHVAVVGRLVGVRAVEQALAGDAGQQPGQLGGLGHVALAVEPDLVRVEPAGQPGRRDLERRTLHPRRVLDLDQRVVVGEEIETLGPGIAAGGHRRADGADVVAQVRGAGRGDAGEDAGTGHRPSLTAAPAKRTGRGVTPARGILAEALLGSVLPEACPVEARPQQLPSTSSVQSWAVSWIESPADSRSLPTPSTVWQAAREPIIASISTASSFLLVRIGLSPVSWGRAAGCRHASMEAGGP